MVQSKTKTVFLVDAIDAGQKFLRVHRAIEHFSRFETIIAAVTWNRKFFAEIFQERRAPAVTSFGIMNHLAQLFLRDALLAFAFLLDESPLLDHIARAEKQNAFTR